MNDAPPKNHSNRTPWKQAIAFLKVLLVYLLLVYLVSQHWSNPPVLTIILALGTILLLWLWWSIENLIIILLGGLLGGIGEFIAIRAGAWNYSNQAGVPTWIPLAWGIAALFLRQLGDRVREVTAQLKKWTTEKKKGVGIETKHSSQTEGAERNKKADTGLEKLIGHIMLVITTVWIIFFLALLAYQLIYPQPLPDGWIYKIYAEHYAGSVGVTSIAIAAFCLVTVFRIVSGDPIELEILGFKFRGAAGPLIMWVISFLAMTASVKLLW